MPVELTTGAVLKNFSIGMAVAGVKPSLATQLSKSVMIGFPQSNAVLDVMASMAKTKMSVGPIESAAFLNRLISDAGVQVSITPSILEVVHSVLTESADGSVVSKDTPDCPTFGPHRRVTGAGRAAGAPDLDRAALQVGMTLIYCAYMAQLQLSENEVIKILLEWFANVGLLAPGYLIWRTTGKAYDILFSSADPEENKTVWPP
jgi:hypothetical protein